jgi:hypothetical protein
MSLAGAEIAAAAIIASESCSDKKRSLSEDAQMLKCAGLLPSTRTIIPEWQCAVGGDAHSYTKSEGLGVQL